MSKLWIVHRQARLRDALARLSGVAPEDRVDGAPVDDAFAGAPAPAALLIGLEDDFERELDFLHRHEARLAGVRRGYLVAPGDLAEVRRLTGAATGELIETPPDPQAVRDFVAEAVARRPAEPLAARRDRARLARRFDTWFGGEDLPGLLRSLDPALADLPLLVRGVRGSGRSLVARYAERARHRGIAARTLHVSADTADPLGGLQRAARLEDTNPGGAASEPAATSIWLEDVDRFDPAVQRLLAEWIRLGPPADAGLGAAPRWVATAGPSAGRDRLDPGLAAALGPLAVSIPSLFDAPEALEAFAGRVTADWAAVFGGPVRRLGADALEALRTISWVGDRLAVEQALQHALARGGEAPISAEALDADLAALRAWRAATDSLPGTEPAPGGRQARPAESATGLEAATDLPEAEITEWADEADAASDWPPMPPTPSEATADLEAAFGEGLAAGVDGSEGGLDTGEAMETAAGTGPRATEDPSRAMTEEAFGVSGGSNGSAGPIGAEAGLPGDAETAIEAATGGATESAPNTLDAPSPPDWRRLARSLSHEIRNPLVSIRTFAELLPEHFEDASFRERFTELVGRDVRHIDDVIDRLARAAEREKPEPTAVDVSALIERLLDARRSGIGERRLLVLRELEREAPVAWADAPSLEIALAGLLDRALAALPERGDLFVATRRIERGPDGAPRLRVLMRHHSPELAGVGSTALPDAALAANAIEYVLAETVVSASGGRLTIDATDAQETLILIDLRTPPAGVEESGNDG